MHKGTMPTVAVVDSDVTNGKLLCDICHVGGWHVTGCARNAMDGLNLVARGHPDCLITDYDFGHDQPGGNGLDLIAQAKNMIPDLFTIMVTGWDINDIAANVAQHQPDRILRKPVPPHLLMNLLERVYSRMNIVRVKAV